MSETKIEEQIGECLNSFGVINEWKGVRHMRDLLEAAQTELVRRRERLEKLEETTP